MVGASIYYIANVSVIHKVSKAKEMARRDLVRRGVLPGSPINIPIGAVLLILSIIILSAAFRLNVRLLESNSEDGPWATNLFVGFTSFSGTFYICFPVVFSLIVAAPLLFFVFRKRKLVAREIFGRLAGWAFIGSGMIFLSSQMVAVAMKPAIYLTTPEACKDTVRLTVEGRTLVTIPERKRSRVTEWSDLELENGKIRTDGEVYDYLFYEAATLTPTVGEEGWTIERVDERFFWCGESVDLDDVRDRIRSLMHDFGLFANEIEDFIEYWLGDDLLLEFGKEDFSFGLYPVPVEEVERIFRIETEMEYNEIVRFHLLVVDIEEGMVLEEPSFPEIERGDYSLHEWGIFRKKGMK